MSLVEAGRYADAVKVIRRITRCRSFAAWCASIPVRCIAAVAWSTTHEHPRPQAVCPLSTVTQRPKPHVVDNTGKRVAVMAARPAGLSCLLPGRDGPQSDHLSSATTWAACCATASPAIVAARAPAGRGRLDLDAGIDVELDHSVNGRLARLRDEFDAVYLAIGAHSDKKLGLPGEEAPGVESAVKMLRAIGDDELPDLSGQRVCVGGGNVAMDVARSAVRCGAE
ncbi:MAG: hypothetical protein ACLTXI_03280 [Collinsella sp.]